MRLKNKNIIRFLVICMLMVTISTNLCISGIYKMPSILKNSNFQDCSIKKMVGVYG